MGRRLNARLEARALLRRVPGRLGWITVEAGPVFVHVDGRPRVLVERAGATIEVAPDREPLVREVQIVRPDVSIDRLEGGALAIAGLVVEAPTPPPPSLAPRVESVAAASSSTADHLLAHLTQALERDEPTREEPWVGKSPSSSRASPLGAPRVGRLIIEDGRIHLADHATAGEPELAIQELSARLEVERVDGQRVGGHLHASVPGLARALAQAGAGQWGTADQDRGAWRFTERGFWSALAGSLPGKVRARFKG